jgi:hypothetical protein
METYPREMFQQHAGCSPGITLIVAGSDNTLLAKLHEIGKTIGTGSVYHPSAPPLLDWMGVYRCGGNCPCVSGEGGVLGRARPWV